MAYSRVPLTVALPPRYAARLFDAQEAGATDQELREIAAEALKEVYFQDGGRRAGSLEEVRYRGSVEAMRRTAFAV